MNAGEPWFGTSPLEGWRHRSGDDPHWARSDLGDSAWTPVSPTYWLKTVGEVRWAAPGVLPYYGWRGVAWFRLHVTVDSTLVGTPLLLSLPAQPGAAEVYLDGQQIQTAGRVGTSAATESTAGERLPRALVMDRGGEHVVAVRYSNFTVPTDRYGGFALQLGEADIGLAEAALVAAGRTRTRAQQAAFTAVPLVVCLLHLVLFLFYRRARENLYYAGFTLLVALAVYATYQSNLPPLIVPQTEWNQVPGFMAPPWAQGLLPLGLLLLYKLLLPQLPKRFWFFAGAYGISALLASGLVGEWGKLSLTGSELAVPLLVILSSFVIWALLACMAHRHRFVSIPACAALALLAGGAVGWWRAPDNGIEAVVTGALSIVIAAQLVVVLLALLELVRVPLAAVIQRQEGAWMIVVGILGIIAAPAVSAALGTPSLALGLMSPVVAVSAFLARRTARTSRDLETQLARVQELSAQTVEQERALREEAEKELRTAHELQMGLLPKGSPAVEGCSSAGRCLPAAQVGGDLFQYYHSPGRLSVALADVTGHAMQAAIPAVMFSGILDSQMRTGGELGAVFGRLNEVLCEKLTGRTHVTLAMAELEVRTGLLQFANAGCPYPCHWRQATGEVAELCLDAYPLGVKQGALYRTVETRLAPGDYLVFCSDGIAEAQDPAGELFGFERTVEAVRDACSRGLSPDGVIDHLVAAVRDFCGETAQGDDITCVVVRMEG